MGNSSTRTRCGRNAPAPSAALQLTMGEGSGTPVRSWVAAVAVMVNWWGRCTRTVTSQRASSTEHSRISCEIDGALAFAFIFFRSLARASMWEVEVKKYPWQRRENDKRHFMLKMQTKSTRKMNFKILTQTLRCALYVTTLLSGSIVAAVRVDHWAAGTIRNISLLSTLQDSLLQRFWYWKKLDKICLSNLRCYNTSLKFFGNNPYLCVLFFLNSVCSISELSVLFALHEQCVRHSTLEN